jgi:hypothetical protein
LHGARAAQFPASEFARAPILTLTVVLRRFAGTKTLTIDEVEAFCRKTKRGSSIVDADDDDMARLLSGRSSISSATTTSGKSPKQLKTQSSMAKLNAASHVLGQNKVKQQRAAEARERARKEAEAMDLYLATSRELQQRQSQVPHYPTPPPCALSTCAPLHRCVLSARFGALTAAPPVRNIAGDARRGARVAPAASGPRPSQAAQRASAAAVERQHAPTGRARRQGVALFQRQGRRPAVVRRLPADHRAQYLRLARGVAHPSRARTFRERRLHTHTPWQRQLRRTRRPCELTHKTRLRGGGAGVARADGVGARSAQWCARRATWLGAGGLYEYVRTAARHARVDGAPTASRRAALGADAVLLRAPALGPLQQRCAVLGPCGGGERWLRFCYFTLLLRCLIQKERQCRERDRGPSN